MLLFIGSGCAAVGCRFEFEVVVFLWLFHCSQAVGKALTKQIANLAREKQLKKAIELFNQFEHLGLC